MLLFCSFLLFSLLVVAIVVYTWAAIGCHALSPFSTSTLYTYLPGVVGVERIRPETGQHVSLIVRLKRRNNAAGMNLIYDIYSRLFHRRYFPVNGLIHNARTVDNKQYNSPSRVVLPPPPCLMQNCVDRWGGSWSLLCIRDNPNWFSYCYQRECYYYGGSVQRNRVGDTTSGESWGGLVGDHSQFIRVVEYREMNSNGRIYLMSTVQILHTYTVYQLQNEYT